MSHRYIELFLNSTGSSSGMSLSGIGNFCGGMIYCRISLIKCLSCMHEIDVFKKKKFRIECFNIMRYHTLLHIITHKNSYFLHIGLGNNFRPGYSPNNRGFSSQLGGNNYSSF